MSHAPERKEKNCLNCGATVIGRFCHACGQENIVPKESFGSLVLHFFYDITHFDGKFFHSLKYLVFRPGFLSTEFMNGRRARHLNPVRMYVFTSAIFFLIFFVLVNPKNIFSSGSNKPLTDSQRVSLIDDLEKEINKGETDSAIISKKLRLLKDTSRSVTNESLLSINFWSEDSARKIYHSLAEYDSVQSRLKTSQKDEWFTRMVIRKQIELTGKFDGNVKEAGLEWVEIFLHKLPYLLFLSLPLFALVLKLLYVRRKRFYYADHAIFTIHHYVFSFILLLVVFLLSAARKNPSFDWLRGVQVALIIIWPVYLYIAMLNFYKQGWFKTFVKFFLLNILGFFSLLLLFVGFFFLSIFQL